jgi:DNA-binding MarR family transcriptional regulator
MAKDREKLVQEFFANFAVLKRQATLNFTQARGKSGMSPSQSELLHIVNSEQPVQLKTLAKQMQLTPGAVTQLVENLVQAGFITRLNDIKDRRIQLISLSKEGVRKVSEMKEYHHKRALDMAKVLTDEELMAMHGIQKKMIDYYSNQSNNSKK